MSDNHFQSIYSQFIYVSRYSKYLESQSRREIWPETIARYFDHFEWYLKEYHDFDLSPHRPELEDAVLSLGVMPSMRALMTAGPALKRDPMAAFNCLSGDTLVTTLEYGIVPISEVAGKKVHIVDGNGDWSLSECKHFGRQPLYEVKFRTSGKGNFTINATKDHRWIKKDLTETTTENLIAGDRLANVKMPDSYVFNKDSIDYVRGVQHGIIYGDGTVSYKYSSGSTSKETRVERSCRGFAIRLCGEKRSLSSFFEGYSFSYPPSFGGDPVIYISDRAIDLKSLPEENDFFTEDYIAGFIHGWFACDGSVCKNKQVSLSATKLGYDWIMRHGVRHGFVIMNKRTMTNETNYGVRSEVLYIMECDRRWVMQESIILEKHKDNFYKIDIEKNPGFGLIESISYWGEDDVYCFIVPTTGSFLLTKNLLTGNCSYLAINKIKSFSEVLYILMLGVGVGFSVETSEVNQLPELPDDFYDTETTVVVEDSKLGWSKAIHEWLSLLFNGQVPKYDVSKVRKKGARLKVFGGRASGPGVLIDLFEFTKNILKNAAGRKLTSLECHDIVCKIADIVICGGVRRCLAYNSRIQTESGFKEIKDICVNDIIITKGKKYSVSEHIYSGKQKILNIHHKFGILKGVTKNHRVAIFDSMNNYIFKKASELKIGDVLVWDSYGIDGSLQKLPNIKHNNHFNSKNINFPVHLNEELAWLFGLIHGDGYIGSKGHIEIYKNDDEWEMLNNANFIFKKYFNIEGKISYDGKGGRGIRLRLCSADLARWFLLYLKAPNKDIYVPSFVFSAERNVRLSYLIGLFDSDGRVTQDGGIDQCTTIYESFKDDLVTLLAGLGIGTKIYYGSAEKRRINGVKAKDYYTIRIVGKTNRDKWEKGLLFSKSTKKDKIKEYIATHNDFSWPVKFHQALEYHGNDMSMTAAFEKDFEVSEGLYPSTITNIEYYEEEVDTYDIAVNDVHQFSVDGIIVHNSATISLSDLFDVKMRNAKSGMWWQTDPHRRLANNSAVYEEDPEIGQFMEEWLSLYHSKSGERGIFSRKATRTVIENSNKFRIDNFGKDIRVRDPNYKWGINPCITKDAWILTADGSKQVKDLIDVPHTSIVNGKQYSATGFWKTGHKQVFKLKTDRGFELRLTEDHKVFVETKRKYNHRKKTFNVVQEEIPLKDLKIGDKLVLGDNRLYSKWGRQDEFDKGWLVGEVVGDGCWSKDKKYHALVRFWGETSKEMADGAFEMVSDLDMSYHQPVMPVGPSYGKINKTWQVQSKTLSHLCEKYLIGDKTISSSLEEASSSFIRGFLSGWFDADGTVLSNIQKGRSVRLGSVHLSNLKSAQRMLYSLGIISTVYENRREAGPRKLPDGNGGLKYYNCQTMHELVISRSNMEVFRDQVGFKDPLKREKLDLCLDANRRGEYQERFTAKVKSVEMDNIEDVYDCTVDEVHKFSANGLIIHNCSEIILRDCETCNLTSVQIREHDNLEILKKKVIVATILGTIQSCLVNYKYVNKKWKKNCEDERLLGVSLNGVFDNALTNGKKGKEKLIEALEELKRTYIKTNIEWAQKLNIPVSAAIGCIKPEGTSSALNGTSSGIHPAHAPFYIRRVRNDIKDPLTQFMIEEGVPHEEDHYDPKNMVCFKFPMKSSEDAICRREVSPIDHLELWKIYQKHYCEQKPSVTISIKENEWLDVGTWVFKNFDWMSGVSFLPTDDHIYTQAPFEECTKEQYEAMAAEMPKYIDWTDLVKYEVEDCTVATQTLACSASPEGCFI
jgi:intein/homing endonuclease